MLLILWIPFAQTTGHHSTTWGFRDSSATFDGVPSDEVLGPSGCTSNRVPDALNIAMGTTGPYFARKFTSYFDRCLVSSRAFWGLVALFWATTRPQKRNTWHLTGTRFLVGLGSLGGQETRSPGLSGVNVIRDFFDQVAN